MSIGLTSVTAPGILAFPASAIWADNLGVVIRQDDGYCADVQPG